MKEYIEIHGYDDKKNIYFIEELEKNVLFHEEIRYSIFLDMIRYSSGFVSVIGETLPVIEIEG